MPLPILITNAGRAAIINAQHTGTAPVTLASVGLSQTAIAPSATDAALAGEFKRVATIAGEVVAPDTIHLTMSDDSADSYALRSFGLYLADGTLFALYGQADPILQKVASSIGLLSIDVIIADVAATALTFGDTSFTNPPATTERQGVVELATVAEAQAGVDALRALTPAAAKAAILGWLLAQDGAGSGLDADLLDGQQGSWYANIPARLGYVPWGPGNDGAGSGLDADLLRGMTPEQVVSLARVISALGFTPANKAGDTFNGPVTAPTFHSTTNGDGTGYAVGDDAVLGDTNIANGASLRGQNNPEAGFLQFGKGASLGIGGAGQPLAYGGNGLWHAGNDGAGSGVDADLLDGHDSSEFLLRNDASTFGSNANGYWEKRANGVIEQWGTATAYDPGLQGLPALTFPIPFTDLASINMQVTSPGSNSGSQDGNKVGGQATSISQFQVYSDDRTNTVKWRAIGR